MPDLLFEHTVGDVAIRVYRGGGLTASILWNGREYPVEARLELDWEGRLKDTSRALLTRVLTDDLKLSAEKVNEIEVAFFSTSFVEKIKGKSASISLRHINDIEDPALCGKLVEVEALISSNSVAMIVPTRLLAIGRGVSESRDFYGDAISLPLDLAGVPAERKLSVYRRNFPNLKGVEFKEDDYRELYRIIVRAPVFNLAKDEEGRLLDEEGREYKSHEIFLISEKPEDFQPSTLIRVTGYVLPHPRTGKPVILSIRWEFPEKISAYDIAKLRRLKTKLDSFGSVREKVEWILTEFEKYSGIVNRRNVALCDFLTYFTPLWIRLGSDTQRGWGNTAIIGDTTTGKSETFRKMQRLLGAGTYLTAETASQVGLTGAAVQAEGQGWFIDWGFLVLEDRRLLSIDGSQKLTPGNWASLAEAERLGYVSIAKAAKAQAPARTRQIKIANPVDEERGKYSTKEMKSFLHAAQALGTVFDKTSIARLDLCVFVREEEVQPEQVNTERSGAPDEDLELLREALKWTWSGRKMKFDEGSIEELFKRSTDLYNKFHVEDLPLVTIDQKYKLARLSAALAALTLSTDDLLTIKVTKEHVDYAADFMDREYTAAGLHVLAEEEKHEVLSEEEAKGLLSTIATSVLGSEGQAETIKAIISFIVTQGRVTQEQLKARFSLAEKSELRPLVAQLETQGLIKRGNGFYPTAKSVQLVKVLGK